MHDWGSALSNRRWMRTGGLALAPMSGARIVHGKAVQAAHRPVVTLSLSKGDYS